MDEAGVLLFVRAPFDRTALGGLRIAGVAQVGGVALVAQQRIADLLAGAGEDRVGPEEGQRMVDRHDRQVLARHLRDQPAPEAGANDDAGRLDIPARGRSEEHTSELQSLIRISSAVLCLKKKNTTQLSNNN